MCIKYVSSVMFDLNVGLLVIPTASMMYQYFVKIVPTIYVKTDGEVRPNCDFLDIFLSS